MEMGTVRGLVTALLLLLFVGVWVWSWSRKREKDFTSAAQLPLEEGDAPPAENEKEETRS
jgi:cytochrome c oxidase cbb3-type subunit IV